MKFNIKKSTFFYIICATLTLFVILIVYWDEVVQSSFFIRFITNAFDSSTSIRSQFQQRAL